VGAVVGARCSAISYPSLGEPSLSKFVELWESTLLYVIVLGLKRDKSKRWIFRSFMDFKIELSLSVTTRGKFLAFSLSNYLSW